MSWNNQIKFSKRSFIEHVYEISRLTMRGERTVPIDGFKYLPYWWVNKEIRIFWEPDIPRQTVDLIVKAIKKRSDEFNMGFVFKLMGSHYSAQEQLNKSLVSQEIDCDRLFLLALSEKWRYPISGGSQHGDVYITSRSFLTDYESWAAASFIYGAMVFCLDEQRQSSCDLLYRIALHETNHLLGMYCHCDDYTKVEGLPYTEKCNMHYSCTHEDLCIKCRTHIRTWWQGVHDEVQRLKDEYISIQTY